MGIGAPKKLSIALVFSAMMAGSVSAASDSEKLIGDYANQVAAGTWIAPDQSAVIARKFIPAFYEARNDRPAWSGGAWEELRAGIQEGIRQGFQPGDFHQTLLDNLFRSAASGEPEKVAAFEIVATDAAARLVHHLIFGKVDASTINPDWNFERPIIEADPVQVLNAYLDGDGFGALLDRLAIVTPLYRDLIAALAHYREIALAGGWPEVPGGDSLKPGAIDPRVALLRERLSFEGPLQERRPPLAQVQLLAGLDEQLPNPDHVYDPALVEDAKRFQERHGLEADGVIGPKTITVLNRSVEERIDQLRLSLERARWFARNLGDDFVLVNIAGARTYVLKNGDTLWTTRSITGSDYRKTPVFRDAITYMEINPTWTVPTSIFLKDKLPIIRNDPGYLARNGYSVRDTEGRTVPASAVNWNASNPGVTLVQRPGPDNALGLIKFMFPNKHSVYLHDTNDRSLFDRNERNLSSGCIRVEYPFELADMLMEGAPNWSRERLNSILESGETTRIELPEPIPVLLTYWTAWVENGEVHFREDIYERDEPVLRALNAAS
jgi:murein L,D-transpeptidase YcbB/YkuD